MPNNIYQKEIDLNQKINITLKNHHLKDWPYFRFDNVLRSGEGHPELDAGLPHQGSDKQEDNSRIEK